MSHHEWFPPEPVLELLATFSKAIKDVGVDFFVVGALARDIQLSAVPGHAALRATKDVDIAIMVGSEQQSNTVKAVLLATGEFTSHEKLAIKLFFRQAIEIDLLPFGPIENEMGEVRVEKPRPFILDVPGFKEVLPEAEVITIGGIDIRVCSLEGIILLKLFANADNPSRTKDIIDIEHILKAYFELSTDIIFTDFEDVPDLYSTQDPDYLVLVSARVVGRVMGRMTLDLSHSISVLFSKLFSDDLRSGI